MSAHATATRRPGDADGWLDVLRSDIDLPWVAVTIDGPGPDGNDPIEVRVIAEKTEPTTEGKP